VVWFGWGMKFLSQKERKIVKKGIKTMVKFDQKQAFSGHFCLKNKEF
jgi:hypothetical protein